MGGGIIEASNSIELSNDGKELKKKGDGATK